MGCVWTEGCTLLCQVVGDLHSPRTPEHSSWGICSEDRVQTDEKRACVRKGGCREGGTDSARAQMWKERLLLQGCLGTMQIQVTNGLRTSLKTKGVTEKLFLPLAFTCSCSGVLCFMHLSSNTSLRSLRCCYWSEGVRVSREVQAAPPSTRCLRGSSLETRWESEGSSVLRAHARRWARLRVLSRVGQTVLVLYLYIGEMGGQKYSFQSREQLHRIGNLSLRVEESQLVELLIWVST